MKKKLIAGVLSAALIVSTMLSGCSDPAYTARVQSSENSAAVVTNKDEGTEAITPTDYSVKGNWYMIPKVEKAVDTFFIYPTIYDGNGGPDYAALDEPQVLDKIDDMYEAKASVFADSTNVFIPYYRQASMRVQAEMGEKGNATSSHMTYPKTDIFAALDYYFQYYNEGRPFIIAGHSQGAALTKLALTDYFKEHPDYYQQMVAAYAIGFSVTEKDLLENPHLKFAEGADDTGVVISWNTEGVGNRNAYNIVVQEGAISINPLNWKRDETPADATENLGSWFKNETTGQYELRNVGADATVDTERGTVITHADVDRIALTDMFGPASYHNNDYALFYENLKQNIALRIKNFDGFE